MGFQFTYKSESRFTLRRAVFQAVDATAECWEYPTRAGKFNHARAAYIIKDLTEFAKEQLGLAAGLASGEPQSVRDAVHQALSAAALGCWEHVDRAGRFDYEQATDIADALTEFIERRIAEVTE